MSTLVDPAPQSSKSCDPASRKLHPSISVETVFCWCHLDVDGLWHVPSHSFRPSLWCGGGSKRVLQWLISPSIPSCRHPCALSLLSPVSVSSLCGLPHCIVCRDSLLALGDNKTHIYASLHGKNACFQGKSQRLASGYLHEYINRMSHTLGALQ